MFGHLKPHPWSIQVLIHTKLTKRSDRSLHDNSTEKDKTGQTHKAVPKLSVRCTCSRHNAKAISIARPAKVKRPMSPAFCLGRRTNHSNRNNEAVSGQTIGATCGDMCFLDVEYFGSVKETAGRVLNQSLKKSMTIPSRKCNGLESNGRQSFRVVFNSAERHEYLADTLSVYIHKKV